MYLAMQDVAIIGGGLSGLALADQLHAQGLSFTLFESRKRLGGRILSYSNSNDRIHFDLGPGWVWPDSQPRVARFAAQHDLQLYPQWVEGRSLYQTGRDSRPQVFVDHSTYGSARRIQGGSQQLIDTLVQRLPREHIKLNYQLVAMNDQLDHVEIKFRHGDSTFSLRARRVVMTMPLRVIADSVDFAPLLDHRLVHLLSDTPTWMAGYAKALIRYPYAFWREAGLSGSALASYQGAILGEVFDASAPDGRYAALSGFFALPAPLRQRYRDDLEALLLAQLIQLFGSRAAEPSEVVIQDWFDETATATLADAYLLNEHPHYGHPWLQMGHWDNKLYFGGTETATEFGGYLEGALEASEHVAAQLLSHVSQPLSYSLGQPLSHSLRQPQQEECIVSDSMTAFNDYVSGLRKTMKRQYDRNINRDLSQQRSQELLLRNVRDVLNQTYQQALQHAEQHAIAIDDGLQAFNGIQDEMLEYAVQKHRTSCAISNFPSEHKPDADYVAETLKATERDWQTFVQSLATAQA